MTFNDASAYLVALESDPTLAIVPMELAAKAQGKTRAAIDRMLRLHQLDEVRVGKARFVRASSLTGLNSAFQEKVRKVRTFLEEKARNKERVFYEPVMDIVGLRTTVPNDRAVIGQILGEVSRQTWAEHKVLLSVIVHRKTTGTTRPGPGFIGILDWFDDLEDWDDEDEVVERETQRVWKFYAE